jgi:hypothetical protein
MLSDYIYERLIDSFAVGEIVRNVEERGEGAFTLRLQLTEGIGLHTLFNGGTTTTTVSMDSLEPLKTTSFEPSYKTPLELFKEGKFLHVAAPMVRYSKYWNIVESFPCSCFVCLFVFHYQNIFFFAMNNIL